MGNAPLLGRAEKSLCSVGKSGRWGGGRRLTRPRTKKTQGCLAAAWDHMATCLKPKLKYDFRQNICLSRSIRRDEKTEHWKVKQNAKSLNRSGAGGVNRAQRSGPAGHGHSGGGRCSRPHLTSLRRRWWDVDARPNGSRGRGRARGKPQEASAAVGRLPCVLTDEKTKNQTSS